MMEAIFRLRLLAIGDAGGDPGTAASMTMMAMVPSSLGRRRRAVELDLRESLVIEAEVVLPRPEAAGERAKRAELRRLPTGVGVDAGGSGRRGAQCDGAGTRGRAPRTRR